jgi:hypothetical protein
MASTGTDSGSVGPVRHHMRQRLWQLRCAICQRSYGLLQVGRFRTPEPPYLRWFGFRLFSFELGLPLFP